MLQLKDAPQPIIDELKKAMQLAKCEENTVKGEPLVWEQTAKPWNIPWEEHRYRFLNHSHPQWSWHFWQDMERSYCPADAPMLSGLDDVGVCI